MILGMWLFQSKAYRTNSSWDYIRTLHQAHFDSWICNAYIHMINCRLSFSLSLSLLLYALITLNTNYALTQYIRILSKCFNCLARFFHFLSDSFFRFRFLVAPNNHRKKTTHHWDGLSSALFCSVLFTLCVLSVVWLYSVNYAMHFGLFLGCKTREYFLLNYKPSTTRSIWRYGVRISRSFCENLFVVNVESGFAL